MKINNYINLSNINYFTSPYVDGASNLIRAFSPPPLSLTNRFFHLVTGMTLLIPVVNTVFYTALKHFATTHTPSHTQQPRPSLQKSGILPNATVKPPHPFHGAGILPYRVVNGVVELLIGKEANGIHRNTWSDFGGQPEKGETPVQTAARECAEETGNLLGNRSTLEKSLKKSNCIGSRYAMYLLQVNDPKITPQRFYYAHHDGEKSEIAWVKARDLFRAAAGNGRIAIGDSLQRLRPPFIGTLKFRGTATAPSARDVFARIETAAREPLRLSA